MTQPRYAAGAGRWISRATVTGLVLSAITLLGALGAVAVTADAPFAVAEAVNCLLATYLAAVTLVLLRRNARRDRTEEHETQVWRYLLLGALILTVAVLAGQAAALLAHGPYPSGTDLGWVVFTVGCIAAGPFFYQGLVRWKRVRTALADPNDILNGIGAWMVVVAIANAVHEPGLHDDAFVFWRTEAGYALIGAGVVLFGSAVTIANLNGLASDARAWLLTGAMATPLAVALAPLALGSGPHAHGAAATQGLILVAAALIGLAFQRPAERSELLPAMTETTTASALTVLIAGVLVLVQQALTSRHDVLVTGLAATAVAGACYRFVTVVRDLAVLARAKHEALTDELTGAANRRAMVMAIDRSLAANTEVALLLIDLDRFKLINDRYGHSVGDRLLQDVSASFDRHVPAGGLLARLGGDEFAVLLTGAGAEHADFTAQRLVEAGATYRSLDGRPLRVYASVGVAHNDHADMPGVELMRRADVAMYRAKSAGLGFSRYDSDLDAAAQEELELSEDLQWVFADPAAVAEQIRVFFQPQVRICDLEVVGAEALARWEHPRHGLLGPVRFVDLVENQGLMGILTERVLHESVTQWQRWRAAGRSLRVSVNLSAGFLAEPRLLEILDDVLARDIDPAQFVMEITETGFMVDPVLAARTIRDMADRGFGISIDDYGTGYSSLSYLNDIPAAELKIDRTFTHRILGDERTAAIVAGTAQIAHRLDMRLLVEGVEDEATLAALGGLGCDEAQGYLFAAPLPTDAFMTWLDRYPVPAPTMVTPRPGPTTTSTVTPLRTPAAPR
ncbi:putative bifunctional diguanylate cyclase/phosphodiesterase [Kineosporia succinea]|uniref:Diguanylate cyclase (GGDEF)-like protein n=1 Tax=Kineosporia succinea TaxID=84632 RepID=A0ABT9P0T9_9ACTN|nr:bifunctional diguanylate cyclase/phosphodiesterase [Kineosporia succinea]MDP9826127.1 diguanylate cyclase (GGDEF)-like protein [Kineosporia succinea]